MTISYMYELKTLQNLDEYFTNLSERREKGVYFYRISQYNDTIKNFLTQYYEAARLSGVIIEGKLQNPDEKNLEYYSEMMGMSFQMSVGFISNSLKKWLPRMDEIQRTNISNAFYDTLSGMRQEGKNDNMLKNAYIKFMCWMYYRFERIAHQLGNNQLPKILYDGEISYYELKMFSVLQAAGCDILLLECRGDENYRKVDAESKYSKLYSVSGGMAFPEGYGISSIRKEMEMQMKLSRLYGTLPHLSNCTNAWVQGRIFDDILTSTQTRGEDPRFFYNCFFRMSGVEDKLTYVNDLYQFQLKLEENKRQFVIIEQTMEPPTMNEISAIHRGNYPDIEHMLMDLCRNIQYAANIELQRLMIKSFLDVMLEENKTEANNVNKLMNKAVYLLCWLKRYQSKLFNNWKMPEIGCFIYLGGCKNKNEALFLKFLSKLPVDVLILVPNLNIQCVLQDQFLFEKEYSNSLALDKFPTQTSDIQMGTAAYHAERELDQLMYQDSGMYREYQYSKAVAVTLRTMYEEIAILWDQELKYRPNFSTVGDVVNMPVIFAKVSGVKDNDTSAYWQGIKSLLTPDTLLFKNQPIYNPNTENRIKLHATEFFRNGKVQKNKIKEHPTYQFGFLREEVQDYILDKLQLLIDQKTIKGTFENGMEYTIISIILNLNMDIIRIIQKFDYTKKNPKLVVINTTESMMSLEDSIIVAFLNLIGFDLLFFIPTGYQNIEKYFSGKLMEEHQIGTYMYDLVVPNHMVVGSVETRRSWRDKIFKRGG